MLGSAASCCPIFRERELGLGSQAVSGQERGPGRAPATRLFPPRKMRGLSPGPALCPQTWYPEPPAPGLSAGTRHGCQREGDSRHTPPRPGGPASRMSCRDMLTHPTVPQTATLLASRQGRASQAERCQPAKGANRYGQRPGRCWCRVSGLRTGGLLLESRGRDPVARGGPCCAVSPPGVRAVDHRRRGRVNWPGALILQNFSARRFDS